MHSGFKRSIFLDIFLGPRQPQVAFAYPAVLDFFFVCLFGLLDILPLARAAMFKAPLVLAEFWKQPLQCKGIFNWEGLDIGKGQEAARLDAAHHAG